MKKIWNTLCWLFTQTKIILHLLVFLLILNAISAVIGVSMSLVTKSLIDAATSSSHEHLIHCMIYLGAIMVSQILLRIGTSVLSTYCSYKFANTLQQKLFKHILHSKWEVQNTYHSANLITRLTGDLGTVNTFITSTLPVLVSFSCTLVSAFFTLLYLEPTMAIIAICVSPISVLAASLLGRKVKKYYVAFQEQNIKHRTFLQESFQNIIVTKAFCQETFNFNKLKEIHRDKFKLALKQTWLSAFSSTFLYIGSYLGYFIVFIWGASHLSEGAGQFGTLTALIQLFSHIQSPLNGLAHYFPQIVTAYASCERLRVIEDFPLEENEPLPENIRPSINFAQVDFAYKKELPVLKKITCQFHPGEIIGLVGPSGEGKTTLIRLLLNLIEPSHGEISVEAEGKSYPLTSSLRNHLSYVPQGNTLFAGTIRSNLLKGNQSATAEDIETALDKACILDFVNGLKDGLDTLIGEKGLGLSEGQAQRIAIARALLSKKSLLILDEATSALDLQTEIKLLKSIQTLPYSPTCLIITHRSSTLSICDTVLALNSGTLANISDMIKNKTQEVI